MLWFCHKIRQEFLFLTDAFHAHFAVPIWTLAGEGAFCIETLLTGLAVVAVLFTLIHICFCETESWKFIGSVLSFLVFLGFGTRAAIALECSYCSIDWFTAHGK